MKHLAIEGEDVGRAGPAQLECGIRDRIEHGLNIRRRLADDAQYLACRQLSLERVLSFVEEAHVLDRNHSLVRECLEEADLRGGELPGLWETDGYGADRLIMVH